MVYFTKGEAQIDGIKQKWIRIHQFPLMATKLSFTVDTNHTSILETSVAGEYENHLDDFFENSAELLNNIAASVAPIPIKLEALEIVALAKISHHFANTRISEKKLSEFDKASLTRCLRQIFKIGDTMTIRACYQPNVKGGFGVRLPSIVYRAS